MFIKLIRLLSLINYSRDVKGHLSYMLFYSALFLVLSVVIAYIKSCKSGYMNFSLSVHSAILGFGTSAIVLWTEVHIISPQLFAHVFTLLISLPHLFALMTALYYAHAMH